MFRVLFLLFIVVPVIEIAVLIQVGELIGTWPTVSIVIISAWLGAKYVRQQGLATMQSVQTKMAQGEMPSNEIVTGFMLLVAGILLVTPGFVTDAIGLSLLVPQLRIFLASIVQRHMKLNINSASYTASNSGGNVYEHEEFTQDNHGDFKQKAKPISHHQGETIEGEFQRKD